MHMWPINNVGLHIYIHIYEKADSAHCTVLRDADTTKTKNRQNKNKRVEISPGVSEHETQTWGRVSLTIESGPTPEQKIRHILLLDNYGNINDTKHDKVPHDLPTIIFCKYDQNVVKICSFQQYYVSCQILL